MTNQTRSDNHDVAYWPNGPKLSRRTPQQVRSIFTISSALVGVFLLPSGRLHPVCTTEMGRTSQLWTSSQPRNVKPIGLSTDTVEEHMKWITT
jgi:alkyl hydroperoxide reductase subunit AhpC